MPDKLTIVELGTARAVLRLNIERWHGAGRMQLVRLVTDPYIRRRQRGTSTSTIDGRPMIGAPMIGDVSTADERARRDNEVEDGGVQVHVHVDVDVNVLYIDGVPPQIAGMQPRPPWPEPEQYALVPQSASLPHGPVQYGGASSS